MVIVKQQDSLFHCMLGKWKSSHQVAIKHINSSFLCQRSNCFVPCSKILFLSQSSEISPTVLWMLSPFSFLNYLIDYSIFLRHLIFEKSFKFHFKHFSNSLTIKYKHFLMILLQQMHLHFPPLENILHKRVNYQDPTDESHWCSQGFVWKLNLINGFHSSPLLTWLSRALNWLSTTCFFQICVFFFPMVQYCSRFVVYSAVFSCLFQMLLHFGLMFCFVSFWF